MSVYSSSSNDSLLRANLSSVKTFLSPHLYCMITRPSSFIFVSCSITTMFLLLPLSIFILYHALQQWRSTSSAPAMSHSDSFTYHTAIMELIRFFGGIFCCSGVYSSNLSTLLVVGFFLISFNWFGEIFFHVLTCVERYLAVVHPITYLSLRKERGVRIRNISIGCVWVLSFAGMSLNLMENVFICVCFCMLTSSFIIISFCSLSVLHVLIRPGPGDQVGRRERVDQLKLRAFYTIMVILGVLVLRLGWDIAWTVVSMSGGTSQCMILACDYWFNFPSSLALPLLFLHRIGKIVCCKKNMQ